MAMTAEAIIFAINSAIRLGRTAQRAYAKSLSSKSIVLPLPNFSGRPNANKAQSFFDNEDPTLGGAQYLARIERLQDIHQRFKTAEGTAFPSNKELKIYVQYYIRLHSLLEREAAADRFNDNYITADDMVALLSIRQYTHDSSKHTSPLQMVAGSIVEIGIDYFNRVPGALNEQSASGRILKNFLGAFDQIPFSNTVQFQRHSRKIVPQLFIATAETISGFSHELTNDPKIQDFIHIAGKGIAEDLFQQLENISDSDNQDHVVKWGRFLLRSTVANAGNYVFHAHDNFFGAKEGANQLIKSTSSVLLEAILTDPHQLNIKAGLNAATLDRLLQTAFSVFAEHPEIIDKENGFKQIVAGVSEGLAQYSFRRPDLFPELLRLVIENTGKNLHFIWQKPDDSIQAPEDIIVKAVQLILAELSRPIPGKEWQPHLSKSQLLLITEELLDEVVQNPAWIDNEVAGKPILAAVLQATVEALAHIPKEERFSAQTFHWLIQLNLRTVAANQKVLDKIKWADDTTEQAILQQALSLVFAYVFHKDTSTPGDRYVLLADLLDYVMDAIITKHPNATGLQLLDLILFESDGIDYAGGFNKKLANAMLDAALDVLATHPELISKKGALGEIVAGMAAALNASSFKESDILAELVRLALENTALNAALVVEAESHEQGYLLVIFIREVLLALSHQEGDSWQPNITPTEALSIVDTLVQALIEHPEWIVEGPDGQIIFKDVLQAVRNALKDLPPGVKISSQHIEYLLALALQTAATSEAVLDKIPWGTDTEKRTVIERALSIIGAYVFREMRSTAGDQLERFAALIEYVMERILIHHPHKKGLVLLQLILFGADDIDYSDGFNQELADDLINNALSVMQQHPDLVSGEEALQNIVSELAASLNATKLREPGILPSLVSMTLELSAQNAALIVGTQTGEAKFLIALALQDILRHLATTNADGQWRPSLSPNDLLDLSESLLEELLQHPHWLLEEEHSSVWQDVLSAVFNALEGLPQGTRIHPEVLEQLILISLYRAAQSPHLLDKIKWGRQEQEQAILQTALDLLVSYVYPPRSQATPYRLEIFLELLDYILEAILGKYPDKRCLLILDLLFFESEVDLTHGFQEEQAEALVAAALNILENHPELVSNELIFQKILKDTARALRAAKKPLDHLLPEFIRLILFYASGQLENLMRLSPNSPRMALVVALEQSLRIITQPPSRGKWRPKLTDEQLIEIVQVVLEKVIENPNWVGNEKLIQLTLEAIYTSLEELRRGQSIPYETVGLLIEAGLDAVGHRKQLVLNFVNQEGEQQQVVLEYALGSLFIKLYDEQDNTAAAWTLTQADTLHSLLTHYLLRLSVGPADQATIDQIQQPIDAAIEQINNNIHFILEDLLIDIEEA